MLSCWWHEKSKTPINMYVLQDLIKETSPFVGERNFLMPQNSTTGQGSTKPAVTGGVKR